RNRPCEKGSGNRPASAEQQKLQIGVGAVGGELEKDPPVPLVAHASSRPLKRNCGAAYEAAPRSLASIRRLLVVLRIAAVRWLGDHLLECCAHWDAEIDVPWRNRLQEPLIVDLVDLAALVDTGHGVIDHFLEGRVVLAQHDAVRLNR